MIVMQKRGVILIYRDNIGIIKFGQSKYCVFHKKHFRKSKHWRPKKGDTVAFECELDEDLRKYVATYVVFVGKT